MKILVTGSSGHLGEALMRCLPQHGHDAIGLDIRPGAATTVVGSIADRAVVRSCLEGVDAVLHTATLHKPHVATHPKSAFVETNITGTLVLLEEAAARGIRRFVFTSTTSAFGAALNPGPGEPAAFIDETVAAVPKNIYGVTKTAAEDLCALFARNHGVNVIVLRTSRFFPEEDDSRERRAGFDDVNAKANEFLFRRVDLQDAADAHLAALAHVERIGFGRFVVSAPSPFGRADLMALRVDPAGVVARAFADFPAVYERLGYRMFADVDRVYVSDRAREALGWAPQFTFRRILDQLAAGEEIGSDLARTVGSKGYHDEVFADGPYPVD